ncbi:transmembrane protein 230-like [Monodon monoceros]|uniref:transmembrane protein 230-like n=1 Tax=Monodon monoceros TaxID=40151 RepID=UPI0010F861E3|nr:transmembrane protein 230-like [Monodon monoceros]
MMQSRTNLATRIPSSKVKYSRLSSTEDGYIDLQFKKGPPKIALVTVLPMVLFLIGAFLIIIGSLLLAGYISKGIFSYEGVDRAVPVLIIGILVFLLGFYHRHIACYAPKGYWGHSYDDMPDFDD